jgi:hypothetical protein
VIFNNFLLLQIFWFLCCLLFFFTSRSPPSSRWSSYPVSTIGHELCRFVHVCLCVLVMRILLCFSLPSPSSPSASSFLFLCLSALTKIPAQVGRSPRMSHFASSFFFFGALRVWKHKCVCASAHVYVNLRNIYISGCGDTPRLCVCVCVCVPPCSTVFILIIRRAPVFFFFLFLPPSVAVVGEVAVIAFR